MSSPGSGRVRKSEPIEWTLLGLLDPQKSQAYPEGYEQARRPLISCLLSMTATPAVDEREQASAALGPDVAGDHLELERDHQAPREHAGDPVTIAGASKEGQHDSDFCYVSSFDRLTSRKPKTRVRPTPLPVGTHLRKVLGVAAVLSIGALVYAWAGGGFPSLTQGVRGFFQTLLKHDGSKERTTPAPVPKDAGEVSDRSGERSEDASRARLFYSNTSIALMPLK